MSLSGIELIEDRDLFRVLLTDWLLAIRHDQEAGGVLSGLRIALDEGKVKTPRLVRKAGMVFEAADAVHGSRGKFVSLHHEGCAVDFVVWEPDALGGYRYITDGGHEAYRRAGRIWVSLHPRCFWGAGIGDANHISIRRGTRA
jgi:hypothetical protein